MTRSSRSTPEETSRILGMGDILTFVEKAQDQVDEKQAKELETEAPEERVHARGFPRPAAAAEENGVDGRDPRDDPRSWREGEGAEGDGARRDGA